MLTTESLELPGKDGFPIRVRVRAPARARGAVVLCHGFKGFMDWGFFPWLTERIAATGRRVIAFDFSGSGMTADGRFADQAAFESNTFGRELRDLSAVLEEARRRGWIEGRFGLFGHSRGGGIAVLHAGRDPGVGALVTWAGIATIQRWKEEELAAWRERGWLEVRNARTGETLHHGTAILDEVRHEGGKGGPLDIEAAAAAIRAPWLIVHGTADETVRADEAHRLHRASGERATLELLDTGHTFGIAHPMHERSAELERAVALTVDCFAARLAE